MTADPFAKLDAGLSGRNADEPGGFDDRVRSRRVDLVQLIHDGIPPLDYLPASEGMLIRGRRHQAVAPRKTGKSLGMLLHAVDMVIAGARVVIFDRENGANLYARRLEAIIAARGLQEQEDTIRAGLAYFEFPRLRASDEADLVALCADADLVIFDSQRMFLTDLGLGEDSSDEYATFMDALVDPLFRAGIATLTLDNTGHSEPKRSRGSSAKADLNEILFAMETGEKFNLSKRGRLRIEITDSRFGTSGRWELELGGGTFGSWQPVDTDEDDADDDTFRPTHLMERASRFLEGCQEPVSRETVKTAIGGNKQYAVLAIERLVQEQFARTASGSRGAKPVESIRPYREADDPRSDRYRSTGTETDEVERLADAAEAAQREFGF